MLNRSRTLVLGVVVVLAAVVIGCKSEYLAGGKLHFDQGRYEQALANFDKALAEEPNSAEVHMWRARALAKLERDEAAAAELEKAASLPNEIGEEISNTRVSFWSARYNSGLADAKAADTEKENMIRYEAAGQTALREQAEEAMMEKLESAVDRFERAIIFAPDSVKNYSNLGKVLFQLGREEEGKQMFLKARSMAGDRPELLRFLFLVFRSLGVQGLNENTKDGFRRAVEMFTEASTFDRPPEEMATIHFNLGVAYKGLADKSEGQERIEALENARDSYLRVLEINPEDAEALENLAFVYLDLETPEPAVEIGRRLLNLEPWNPGYHLVMVRIYNAAGESEKSVAHLMLRKSFDEGTPLNPGAVRDETRDCPGSDMQRTLLDRGEPEQLYRYSGSRGDYLIWIYWTEGRVFIFQRCTEVFRGDFKPVPPEKLPDLIGE